jgi:hypothetical protein
LNDIGGTVLAFIRGFNRHRAALPIPALLRLLDMDPTLNEGRRRNTQGRWWLGSSMLVVAEVRVSLLVAPAC